MDYYQIVKNEDELRTFIDWLPELGDNEKYYLSLFARKKYSPQLVDSNDRTQLKRFTSDKERMIDKIYQLELQLGRWKLKNKEAPQESLVLYIHPNPRDMVKATKAMGIKCWKLMDNNHYNPIAECMSCIQKSKSNNHKLVTFDFDSRNIDLNLLSDILSPDCYSIIETKGGYHVIVHTPTAYTDITGNRTWYKTIKDYYGDIVDNVGDLMSPVPGTIQGGFIPNMLKYGNN